MRKLVFTLFIVLLGVCFMAREQEEEVRPVLEEPEAFFTGGGVNDEDGDRDMIMLTSTGFAATSLI